MMRSLSVFSIVIVASIGVMPKSWALEPPTPEQVEKYHREGTLEILKAEARAIGNHRAAPHLVQQLWKRVDQAKEGAAEVAKGLPATGNRRVFALLIDFTDYRGSNSTSDFNRRVFPGTKC